MNVPKKGDRRLAATTWEVELSLQNLNPGDLKKILLSLDASHHGGSLIIYFVAPSDKHDFLNMRGVSLKDRLHQEGWEPDGSIDSIYPELEFQMHFLHQKVFEINVTAAQAILRYIIHQFASPQNMVMDCSIQHEFEQWTGEAWENEGELLAQELEVLVPRGAPN